MTTLAEYLTTGSAELGFPLTRDQLADFSLVARELRKWNEKINLTALVDERDIAVKHFLDSLTVLPMLTGVDELLDIGSGGGFPGIPLKIVEPTMRIVSVDSIQKKINFQRHLARTLKFSGFTALPARVEDLAGQYPHRFSHIVSRAFASLGQFAKVALPLLAPQGKIIAMKGSEGREEAQSSAGQLAGLGLGVVAIEEFRLPVTGELRTLILMTRLTEEK